MIRVYRVGHLPISGYFMDFKIKSTNNSQRKPISIRHYSFILILVYLNIEFHKNFHNFLFHEVWSENSVWKEN